ncbi:hypothetical protein [Sphingomonas montanisoli]|uniref:hypothetical protein n=1 Tax=Sphingomonas montanisoli TaxID=2606412 RepID=UPI001CA4DFE7|nr:hypothetical protein [Sphingomonas montanisoli]
MMAAHALPPALVAANDALEPCVYGGGIDAAAMPAGAVDAWVRNAQPGAKTIYARGHLPRWAKGPAIVRDYAAIRLVALTQTRGADGICEYWVERTSAAFAELPGPPPPPRPRRGDDEAQLLELLGEIAEAGQPCPSNFDLAHALDISGPDRVKYLLHCLQQASHITRAASDWAPGRIVTIVATGKATTVAEGVRR